MKKVDRGNRKNMLLAEQSRAEQSRAEQSRAEQSRAEQSNCKYSVFDIFDIWRNTKRLLITKLWNY